MVKKVRGQDQDISYRKNDQRGTKCKRNGIRRFLLLLGPLTVAVVAGYMYWTGGRIVHTDNAYVQADKVVISAEVSGPIVAVRVKENELVKKGQPLFAIDDRSYLIVLEEAKAHRQEVLVSIRKTKASYRQKLSELKLAESDIDFAKKEFERQSTLDLTGAVAKAQLDTAKHDLDVSRHRLAIIQTETDQILAELEGDPLVAPEVLAGYRLAKAEVERAALDVARTVIRAPFSGRVSKIPQVGKHVDPGTSVMSLIANENFWVEANLKETELTHVRPGQHVSIEIDTYPEMELDGTVDSISPATGAEFSIIPAQNATGNWVKVVQRIAVRVDVEEKEGGPSLLAGMSAIVKVKTQYQRTLPSFALRLLELAGFTGRAQADPLN